jgi:hypothetical protein
MAEDSQTVGHAVVKQQHVAEGLLHCCFGRHTPLGRAHLCWVPDCVTILSNSYKTN